RTCTRLFDDFPKLLFRCVTLDVEADADSLVAVADLVREAKNALEVDVSLDSRLNRREVHTPHCSDVADAGGDTRGEAVEEELDWRRPTVLADEHRRMIRSVRELRFVFVLAAGAAERLDARLAVRSALPRVAGAEPELGESRGSLDDVDGRE